MGFLTKSPSRVSRVLDEDKCPPFTVHDVRDYPDYYDALYYPHYHEPTFATARSFCAWLLKSLVAHHTHCLRCNSPFSGCVSFDGNRVIVASGEHSVSLPVSYFEGAGYYHCSVFRLLMHSPQLIDVYACSLSQHPPWLFTSEDIICSQLKSLPSSTLSRTVTRLACVNVHPRTKTNYSRAICSHFVHLRTTILAKSLAEVVNEFGSVQLPTECRRCHSTSCAASVCL
ncbi:hypothetical protein EDD22DRAFT_894824 [Suillus occidentalis]|nr:hypothetical protein EDD22DRAFT_894824 [Suillus occidentalis]